MLRSATTDSLAWNFFQTIAKTYLFELLDRDYMRECNSGICFTGTKKLDLNATIGRVASER